MKYKRGSELKKFVEWVRSCQTDTPMPGGDSKEAWALIDWYNKKLGIGVIGAIEVLTAYTPRRLEELDAQRKIETED